jgi:heme oxygenase
MPTGLAARLRRGTATLHRQAEDAGLMREIFAGRVDRGAYVRLLRALHPVYLALEEALRHHPAALPVALDLVARVPALTADLVALHGAGWADEVAVAPAAEAYAGRIRQVAETHPILLAAHAYVRYLGDLSGGQMMAVLIGRGLELADGAGVEFYRFGALSDPAEGKRAFRAGLDALPVTDEEQVLLVAEARLGFAANLRVFDEVTLVPSRRTSPSAG